MGIDDIQFVGLIQNRKLSEITGPELIRAVMARGWKEGTGTHFFQQLRKDGPSRGIHTPADLARAIAAGTSTPGREGKTIHRICSGTAYIVYNAGTKTLITFSQGNPPMATNLAKALAHLRAKAGPPYGIGRCAAFVREALEAGDLTIPRTGSGSAKDYGPSLLQAGFEQVATETTFVTGDVAVIAGFTRDAAAGIKKDHVHGHMAMFDGTHWISDFRQPGNTPYPGSDYEKAKPGIVIYRYPW